MVKYSSMVEIVRKSHFDVELKTEGDEEGTIVAVFSTFGNIDRDGDVMKAGAIPEVEVPMASWGHAWGDLPVGKGKITVTSHNATFTGKFFLDTPQGMAAYQTVKDMGKLQQWSWGFGVKESEEGDVEGKSVRFITKTEPFEVSPVLVGSNPETNTEMIKTADVNDESKTGGDTEEKAANKPAAVEKAIESVRPLLLNSIKAGEATWKFSVLTDAMRSLEFYKGELEFQESTESKEGIRNWILKNAEHLQDSDISIVDNRDTDVSEATYAEQAERVLNALANYAIRSISLAGIREGEGRTMSSTNLERIAKTLEGADEVITMLRGLLETVDGESVNQQDETDENITDEDSASKAVAMADIDRARAARLRKAKLLNHVTIEG